MPTLKAFQWLHESWYVHEIMKPFVLRLNLGFEALKKEGII